MCKCGCNTCETKTTGPLLTEIKVKSLLSENLQFHIDQNIPLCESKLGLKSKALLIKEARKMYSRNILDLSEEDEVLIKTYLNEVEIGDKVKINKGGKTVDDCVSLEEILDLTEHTITFTKEDMSKLHKNGKLVKADKDGKDHTYIYQDEPLNEVEKISNKNNITKATSSNNIYEVNSANGKLVASRLTLDDVKEIVKDLKKKPLN